MNKLKRARLLAGLSQRDLAVMSGVSLYRIQRISYGWGEIRSDEAKKMAKVLNVKPTELMGA